MEPSCTPIEVITFRDSTLTAFLAETVRAVNRKMGQKSGQNDTIATKRGYRGVLLIRGGRRKKGGLTSLRPAIERVQRTALAAIVVSHFYCISFVSTILAALKRVEGGGRQQS